MWRRWRGRVVVGRWAAVWVVAAIWLLGWAVGVAGARDWPQFMGGKLHQGRNPVESVLSGSSVSGLALAWSAPIGLNHFAPNSGSPSVSRGVVYIGSVGIRAYDRETGALLWSRRSIGTVTTTPAVIGDHVIVGTVDDTVKPAR